MWLSLVTVLAYVLISVSSVVASDSDYQHSLNSGDGRELKPKWKKTKDKLDDSSSGKSKKMERQKLSFPSSMASFNPSLSTLMLSGEETEPMACLADLQECQESLSTCKSLSRVGHALRGKSSASCEEELDECRALLDFCLTEHISFLQMADLCTLEPLENGRYRFRIDHSNFGNETKISMISDSRGLLDVTTMETRAFMQSQELEYWDNKLSFQFNTKDGFEETQELVVGSMTIVGQTDTDFFSAYDVDGMSLPNTIEYRYDVEVIGGILDPALFGDVNIATFYGCIFETTVAASSFGPKSSTAAPSSGLGAAPNFGLGAAPDFGLGAAPNFGSGSVPDFGLMARRNSMGDVPNERLKNRALTALENIGVKFGDGTMTFERATELGVDRTWLQNPENFKDLQKNADTIGKAAPKLAAAIKQCKADCANFDGMLSSLSDLLITAGPLVSIAFPPAGAALTVIGSMGIIFGALVGEQPSNPPTLKLSDIKRALEETLDQWSTRRDETEILVEMEHLLRHQQDYVQDFIRFEKQQNNTDPDLDGDIKKWYESFKEEAKEFIATVKKVEIEYREQLGQKAGRRLKFNEEYLKFHGTCQDHCNQLLNVNGWDWYNRPNQLEPFIRSCSSRLDSGEKAYKSIVAYARGYLDTYYKLSVWMNTIISILQLSSFCDPEQYNETTRLKNCDYYYNIRKLQTDTVGIAKYAYKVGRVQEKISKVCLTDMTSYWPFDQECHRNPSDKLCNYPNLMAIEINIFRRWMERFDEKSKMQYLSDHPSNWWPWDDSHVGHMRDACNAFYQHNYAKGFASASMFRYEWNSKSERANLDPKKRFYVWKSGGNHCSEMAYNADSTVSDWDRGTLVAVPNYCINADGCVDLFENDFEWL